MDGSFPSTFREQCVLRIIPTQAQREQEMREKELYCAQAPTGAQGVPSNLVVVMPLIPRTLSRLSTLQACLGNVDSGQTKSNARHFVDSKSRGFRTISQMSTAEAGTTTNAARRRAASTSEVTTPILDQSPLYLHNSPFTEF